MAFKYPKPTQADDILAWFNARKTELDDYFAGLPLSNWDDYIPRSGVDYSRIKHDAFMKLKPEQQSQYIADYTPEQIAIELEKAKKADYRNYLIDIERQAKRFGYKPSVQRIEADEFADYAAADDGRTEKKSRSAKASQGVTQSPQSQRGFNPETLLPEGIELDVAIAIAKQNAAKKFPNSNKKQQSQFYKEMEAQGLARDIVGQQWVDNRVLGGWVNGEGGKKTRTVDQSKLEAMRAAYQQPVVTANAPQGVVNEVVQEVPSSSAVPIVEVATAPVAANAAEVVSVPQEDIDYFLHWAAMGEQERRDLTDGGFVLQEGQWIPGKNFPTAFFTNQVKSNPIRSSQATSTPVQGNITYHNFTPLEHTPQASTTTGQRPEDAEDILNALDQTNFQTQQTAQQSVPVSIPVPENVPPQNVNPAVYAGSKAASTSADISSSGSMNFEGEQFNKVPYIPSGGTPNHPEIPGLNEPVDPEANLRWLWEQNQKQAQAREQYWQERKRQEANTGSLWGNVWDGTKRGFQYSVDAGKIPGRTASVVWNRAPQSEYEYLTPEGRAGFLGGRVVGEIGNGTKQVLWNLFPDDFTATKSTQVIRDAGGNRMAQVVIPYATTTALQLGSQTYNPFNLAQGGRVAGYTAINPDEEDPRVSTTPVSEFIIDRGFLGRRGKLLPWEQFREERPDIPYEQYRRYQEYLFNRDENLLRDVTGGLIKGTMDGINGPEVSVMGYSVTPVGALAATGTLLAGRHLVGRTAALRM